MKFLICLAIVALIIMKATGKKKTRGKSKSKTDPMSRDASFG